MAQVRASRTLGALEAALQAAEKGGAAAMGDAQIGIDKSELGTFEAPRVRWKPSTEAVAKIAAWNITKLATGTIDEAEAVAAEIAAGPPTSEMKPTLLAAAAAAPVAAAVVAAAAAADDGCAHVSGVDDSAAAADGDDAVVADAATDDGLSRVIMPKEGSAGLDKLHESLSQLGF